MDGKKDLRLDAWHDDITGDVLASVLSRSASVVDVKRLLIRLSTRDTLGQTTDYPSLWVNRLALWADAIDRHIVAFKTVNEFHEIAVDDIHLRHTSGFGNNKRLAHKLIRNLNDALEIGDKDRWGTWPTTPIIGPVSAAGTKRKAAGIDEEPNFKNQRYAEGSFALS